MRRDFALLPALLPALLAALAPAAPAVAAQPYEGLWGTRAADCRDPDGVRRLEINRAGLFWYETRCRPGAVARTGPLAWTMRVACEGEGERFRARPRLSLPGPDRLVIEDAPVTPVRRQSYVRCKRR